MEGRNVSIEIFGEVQGVWYRYFTKKEADKLGLCGYVINREDGSVYAEVSGPGKVVEQLINWCKKGSPLSRVDKVLVGDIEKVHQAKFDIK